MFLSCFFFCLSSLNFVSYKESLFFFSWWNTFPKDIYYVTLTYKQNKLVYSGSNPPVISADIKPMLYRYICVYKDNFLQITLLCFFLYLSLNLKKTMIYICFHKVESTEVFHSSFLYTYKVRWACCKYGVLSFILISLFVKAYYCQVSVQIPLSSLVFLLKPLSSTYFQLCCLLKLYLSAKSANPTWYWLVPLILC